MFTKQNVITARFIDNEHTTIEVVHTIESDEKAHAYILEYDKDSEDFKSLEKAGWDLEAITEETIAYKKEASRLFNEVVNVAAAEMNKTNIPVNNIVNHILEFNEDEDIIFKSKLAIMELDIVKKSRATKVKQEIRKAKTLLEVISNMHKIMK